jgi:GntR family transcriptional regulator/MocR family aminotransferase
MWLGNVREGPPRQLQRRLYEAIRSAILRGVLAPGTRLPPTRVLAEDYGIARQTAVLVYERLLDEGYVVARVGAGTFVAETFQAPAQTPRPEAPEPRLPRSRWAQRATAAQWEQWSPERPELDFRPGVPDWAAFPHARWRRLLARRWRAAGAEAGLAQYGDPAGYRPLREALASFLAQSRGLRCRAGQIVIVSGSQQALDLLARIALDPGDRAAVEDPGYPPAHAIFRAAGATLVPVPVDPQGLDVAALRAAAPRLVYVTPSHQYPTGATLSLGRRLELLEWAAQAGALVVEDDYESELRYGGPPLPALQGLDRQGCVAYVGSCSSVLFPPLRVGWIVAPPALIEALVAAKWLADRQTSTLDQQVLADFIAEGDFARHLRRSRALYGRRRALLEEAVHRFLPPSCRLGGEPAGLQTPLYLPPGTDELAVVRAAAARGVGVYPLGPCFVPAADDERGSKPGVAADGRQPGLLLGFAAVPDERIAEGIRRLAAAIEEARRA